MWITRKKHLCIIQETTDRYEFLLNGRKELIENLKGIIDGKDSVIYVLSDRIDTLMKENEKLKEEKSKTVKQIIWEKVKGYFSKLLMIG